ncbi:hypothetical protein CEXT_705631 [Caerostris extrusa]|uniref:Uncharacterized protein n=1 Tax=Caerostris extrusa TaxID=172846 RepID=A0AAV4MQK8_CAEEX|nr:hypothetical protein CEXT_705631 [Caerostris extrusa]
MINETIQNTGRNKQGLNYVKVRRHENKPQTPAHPPKNAPPFFPPTRNSFDNTISLASIALKRKVSSVPCRACEFRGSIRGLKKGPNKWGSPKCKAPLKETH